ncbi:MAG: hypothetical protein RLZZ196_3495 [Bacteroidota bacterium]|jgi:hypothetical protein
MKAESLTKKQLGEFLVSLAIDKIELWAQKEINNLAYRSKKVVCLPLSNTSWLVGKYKIIMKNESYLIYLDNILQYTFYNRKAAFIFCVLDKLNCDNLSYQILQNDQLVNRLYNDLQILKQKNKIYYKKNNDKFFIVNSKLSEVKLKLEQAKKDLEKNLISAKYLKVWD